MDLSTTYLGIELPHPVMPSASQPLTRDLDSVKRLEDGGAAAVVLHSLFEEQIRTEASNLEHFLEHGTEAYAEALSYFPAQETYVLGPDEYIDHVRACKEALGIPVVGSLNGVSAGVWTEYAGLIEQAGPRDRERCGIAFECERVTPGDADLPRSPGHERPAVRGGEPGPRARQDG